jgi:hypothetical protein
METLRQRLRSRRAATRAAASGSAPPAPRPSAPMATTPRACASGRTVAPPPRRQGLGPARVPQPRRPHRARHAQHQARAAPPAPLRARGRADELDLPGTIDATARNAGLLDLQMVPERHNAVKVLLLLDVGGSMDDHIASARSCSRRRAASSSTSSTSTSTTSSTSRVEGQPAPPRRDDADRPAAHLRPDYKLVFVGDATMSPYEILQPGGSVEHWNEEPGAVWMQRDVPAHPRGAGSRDARVVVGDCRHFRPPAIRPARQPRPGHCFARGRDPGVEPALQPGPEPDPRSGRGNCLARGRDPAGPPASLARSELTRSLWGGHWPPRPRAREVTPDSALPRLPQRRLNPRIPVAAQAPLSDVRPARTRSEFPIAASEQARPGTVPCGDSPRGSARVQCGRSTSTCSAGPGRKGVGSPFTQASCPAR